VISPFTFAYKGAVINSGHQQFYKDNLTVTTLSEGNTYVITIADWEGVKNIYEKYTVNELNIEYRKLAEEYFEANNRTTSAMQNSEYALMKQFGSTINLYKKEVGSTNYVPLRINNFESIAKNPCI
jgi:hypothetical protein